MRSIREAHTDDLPELMALIDGAYLDANRSLVQSSLDAGNVLVAIGDQQIIGTIVLTSSPLLDATAAEETLHVHAIAVRRARRNQGIGSALVTIALDRTPTLTATFDERVKPFYCSLGFQISQAIEDRYWGVIHQPEAD